MIDETKPCDLKEVTEMDVVNSYKEDNESLKNEIIKGGLFRDLKFRDLAKKLRGDYCEVYGI